MTPPRFRVNTPNGYAIDHGTRFSVSVSQSGKLAEFEVQDGEISLHHNSGEVRHLFTGEALNMNVATLAEAADPLFEGFIRPVERSVVLGSSGKEVSIIVWDKKDRLNPNYLMVKTNPHHAVTAGNSLLLIWKSLFRNRLIMPV